MQSNPEAEHPFTYIVALIAAPFRYAFYVWAGSHVLQWLGCTVPHG